ncbi:MAG TPA: ribosome biogenesis GTPase Der [bacterium]|nr:ribosome biogenesis GTPase Der [bacterium]HPS31509.1 ribosome biogenesis GTPase Der [bacterium]
MPAKNQNNVKPLIAIIGRPNVGKSTLFNKIMNKNFAIVDDMPGVTRDLNYQDMEYYDKPFTIIDTGGFHIDEDGTDEITKGIRSQINEVLDQIDGVIFLCDGEAGINSSDKEIYHLIRVKGIRCWLAVSKIDSEGRELWASEFYETGADEVFPVSGKTGYGVNDLLDEVTKDFWTEKEIHEKLPPPEEMIKIAIIGRPNVGKSTLVNSILGEDKMLVSSIPGTTMDPIDSFFKYKDRSFKVIDTAGVRRKKKIEILMEKAAIVRAFRAIDRSDIVIFMMDANEISTDQDLRILGLAHEKGKGIIIVINKWDLVEKETGTYEKVVRDLRDRIKFAPYAPVISIAAISGMRVSKLLDKVLDVYDNYFKSVDTGSLLEWLDACVRRNPAPLNKKNRPVSFSSIEMVSVAPPTVVMKVNSPEAVHFSYDRYLMNRFYETFPYEGVPIKFVYRRGYRKIEKKS